MRGTLLLAFIAMLVMPGCGRKATETEGMNQAEVEAIKTVIVNAYIHGLHETQDPATVKAGFHKEFAMLVPEEDGDLRKVSVDAWLDFVENTAKVKDPELWKSRNTYSFDSVDLTDHAASVKIQVYKGGKKFSTDYLLLYKFGNGWRVVSKIFKLW